MDALPSPLRPSTLHPPDAMTETFDGRCQCGEVQYRVTGASATLFTCHCTECQRQSSSAFGMALWVRQAQVALVAGEPKEWIRTMPSGRRMACRFCGTCGTRLFHQTLGQSEFMSIKPGTLDHTLSLNPVGHIWTGSKQAWFELPEGSLHYSGNPPSFEDLIAAWRAAHD